MNATLLQKRRSLKGREQVTRSHSLTRCIGRKGPTAKMLTALKNTARRHLPVKTSKPPRIGLADLPVEAILCICQHLCPHCLGLPLTFEPTSVEKKLLQSLKTLSQTVQRYRALVRPFLFHRPRFGSNPSSDFIRECHRNHDTASQVKELHGLASWHSKLGMGVCLRRHAKYFLIRARLISFEPFRWESIENDLKVVIASARLSLITTPDIEVLNFTLGLGDISHRDKDHRLLDMIDRANGLLYLEPNPELVRLRALRMCAHLGFFGYRHADRLIQLVTPQQPSLTEVTFVGSIVFTEQMVTYITASLKRFLQGIKCLRFFSTSFYLNGSPYRHPLKQ